MNDEIPSETVSQPSASPEVIHSEEPIVRGVAIAGDFFTGDKTEQA